MPIEPATYISTLVATNPPSGDQVAEGDDHLRLLKSVLLASFPNIAGAVTPTHTVLNGLDGRVTALETSTGLLDNGVTVVPISGVLEQAEPFNANSTLNYTYLLTDRGKIVTRTNAAAMGDTLPQATGSFGAGWFAFVENIHASSLLTITPTTSTINGAASLIVYPGFRVKITSDGTNYRAVVVSITGGQWRRQALSGAYTIVPTDVRPPTHFDYTTAGFTISTNVAASNFSNQPFVIRNSAASGVVTFDPNSSETVDGASTLLINPGEAYVIVSDGTNYKSIASNVAPKFLVIASKTGNYTATTSDRNKSIRFAGLSADATLTLPSAASCGDGFLLFVSNEDTSDWGVTVDPNASELIDGFSSRKTYPGARLLLLCDGTGWRTVGGEWHFFSGNQSITVGALTTMAHSLGVRPKNLIIEMVCINSDGNYSPGDIIVWSAGSTDGVTVQDIQMRIDATNVYVRWPSTMVNLPNKNTGSSFVATAGDWNFRIHAWG